ncbi:MAG: 2-dehydropantoate 2-reductase [Methanomicrobiales archaeon HGW-Methanomicrobiales-4]|nr:MAG: 2-dehydropantoate 2-reductase [Methanomicrobiales archaeon HGW-Methanomicrobiales-4]
MSDEEVKRPLVVILGAGAVGLSLAGRLARVSSVFVACRPAHTAVIRERGLIMSGIWGDQVVSDIECIEGPDACPPDVDYFIITAKGTDTQNICREYADIIRSRPVVTLQNGIGNEDLISNYSGLTIGGTIITNFSIQGDGHVRVKSESGPVMVGLWNSSEAIVLTRFVTLMKKAGIPIQISSDIRAAKWGKSLLNIAVNPLCALLSAPVGSTGEQDLTGIITGLIMETFAVMKALGITVEWNSPEAYLTHLFTVQIPDFAQVYPSMYYDIRDGKQTEIEFLNGYISAQGDRLKIATPYNHCIVDLIRFRQKYHS